MLTLRAYAKVNLTLEVLRRRPDGYHTIATVLQTIDLADTLTFEPSSALSVECSTPGLADDENLVYRAARLLQAETGHQQGARIHLGKGIPVAAGLGGGSSDAATTLVGLDQLWGLGLTTSRLHRLAVQLGSDVPFFLQGATALVEGRGEKVTPLPPILSEQGDMGVVLLHPPMTIPGKTGVLYRALLSTEYTDGGHTGSLVRLLEAGAPLREEGLFNAFDAIAFDSFPGLEGFWRAFEEAGAHHVHLAGTGPTLFTLAPWQEAEAVHQRLHSQEYEAYLVKMINPAR